VADFPIRLMAVSIILRMVPDTSLRMVMRKEISVGLLAGRAKIAMESHVPSVTLSGTTCAFREVLMASRGGR